MFCPMYCCNLPCKTIAYKRLEAYRAAHLLTDMLLLTVISPLTLSGHVGLSNRAQKADDFCYKQKIGYDRIAEKRL